MNVMFGIEDLTKSRNPVGVVDFMLPVSQGSDYVATLGFGPESLWDSGGRALKLINRFCLNLSKINLESTT